MSGRYPTEQYAFNQRQAEAHKGYLITPTIGGQFTISKDRAHICYANSRDEARATIDQLVEVA